MAQSSFGSGKRQTDRGYHTLQSSAGLNPQYQDHRAFFAETL